RSRSTLRVVGEAFLHYLASVVRTIPLDESLNTFFDRCTGTVSDIARQCRHVSQRIRYIARLQRQEIHLGFAAKALLKHFDVAQQLYRSLIADVIQSVWRAT